MNEKHHTICIGRYTLQRLANREEVTVELSDDYRVTLLDASDFPRSMLKDIALTQTPDPRDPDPSRSGIFRDHNCSYCKSGEKPCVQGNPSQCEFPMARND